MDTERDFNAFMAKLPRWAQDHVTALQADNTALRQRVERLTKGIATDRTEATVFMRRDSLSEDEIGLNGGPVGWLGQRDSLQIRFSDDSDHSWSGLRFKWTDNVTRDGARWVEVSSGDGAIEVRAGASNIVFIRQGER